MTDYKNPNFFCIKDKEYPKYTIVVPPKDIEKLGWTDGEDLKHEIKYNILIIKSKKNRFFN